MEGLNKLARTSISGMANGVRVVCVTGGGGYIGSWLVKNLLEAGYTVHATLRDPGAQERLKLFQAGLLEEGSFDSAVEGCQGVFHVASPIRGDKECTVEDLVVTAVNGVLNVLRACTRAKSVKRVVCTSSITAAYPLSENGELASSCLDESCWSPVNFLKSQTIPLAWYMASKTLAEQEALKYGAQNKLEVVTLLPSTVVGPWLTNTPGFSSFQTILSLLGENSLLGEGLKFVQFRLGSIALVHIDDICNAHIFLMEHPNAQGRHVCSVDSRSLNSLKEFLAQQLNVSLKLDEEDPINKNVSVSSKKLLDMGFSYKCSLEQAIEESIGCAVKNGILKL